MNNDTDKNLERPEFWQTQDRGSNDDEYQIYVACMRGTTEYIKTYEEWLTS